jgi:hypothetical protein
MTRPVVVSIPHQLGKAEAKRRLESGFGQVKQQLGGQIATLSDTWEGDRMGFELGIMGQKVRGHLDVTDDHVRLEVQLPWMLAMFADKAKAIIQRQGTLLLEKK